MRLTLLAACLVLTACARAEATAYTATQTGNWSAQSTWGGIGPPGSGDTASIGAFTVTVDTSTTVGTSPNDTTTKVVDVTSGSGVLSVANGVTLTIKGNLGGVNGSTLRVGAGEVSELKSNLVWGGASTAGSKIAARISGTTNGIITASGADYNGVWNTEAGDNGRGYDDYSGNLDLWTGGAASSSSAANANVDDHQVTANPLFVDPARNLAKWCYVRGYGAQTTAAGLAALAADPTRIADLIAYVKAGFAPTNPVLRVAGHDGATIGAIPWVNGCPALFLAP